jgi:hypothetical protein
VKGERKHFFPSFSSEMSRPLRVILLCLRGQWLGIYTPHLSPRLERDLSRAADEKAPGNRKFGFTFNILNAVKTPPQRERVMRTYKYQVPAYERGQTQSHKWKEKSIAEEPDLLSPLLVMIILIPTASEDLQISNAPKLAVGSARKAGPRACCQVNNCCHLLLHLEATTKPSFHILHS